ncbi:MAG: shikimate dehydrogenase [Actinobacteria bacterium]|nr:shikimate dehydrogenase [Actinomycetota bacterium]
MTDSNTKLIGLFGNPARHSLSPKIQNYFISKYKKNCLYVVFEPTENNLEQAFIGTRNLEFIGLNVTMPFKEKIFTLVDQTDKTASFIKAINTVKFIQDKVSSGSISIGYSTDVPGFIKALDDKKFLWTGKKCLVIGAGGVAKSTVYGLGQKKVGKIYVFDIIRNKALELINIFNKISSIEVVEDLNDLNSEIENIDLIVNCSPAGMNLESKKELKKLLPVPSKWNLKDKFIFEMVYNPWETKFIQKGKKEGATIVTGIDMLINQAAYSFKIWFGILPDTNEIKKIILDSA